MRRLYLLPWLIRAIKGVRSVLETNFFISRDGRGLKCGRLAGLDCTRIMFSIEDKHRIASKKARLERFLAKSETAILKNLRLVLS